MRAVRFVLWALLPVAAGCGDGDSSNAPQDAGRGGVGQDGGIGGADTGGAQGLGGASGSSGSGGASGSSSSGGSSGSPSSGGSSGSSSNGGSSGTADAGCDPDCHGTLNSGNCGPGEVLWGCGPARGFVDGWEAYCTLLPTPQPTYCCSPTFLAQCL